MSPNQELSCDELALHLESLRRGDASADLATLADSHLARCPACRRQLAHLKRLSEMFSAWRPLHVPSMVKIETAALVSPQLGELASQLLPQEKAGKLRRRRRLHRLPPLRSWQSALNWMAVAALIFAAAAIIYQVSRDRHLSGLPSEDSPDAVDQHDQQPADPAGQFLQGDASGYDVILLHGGSREAEVAGLLRDITGLAPSSVREMLRQTPAVISRHLTEQQAREIIDRLREAGAEAEIRPQQP